MELKGKGQTASIAEMKMMMITLAWTSAADFDLFALYKLKDGSDGLVYFGNKGDMNAFPFMALDKDAGVGDAGGDNKETMRIAKFDDSISEIYIGAWDYGAIEKGGEAARFEGSDVKLTIVSDVDPTGNAVLLETGLTGNFALVAKLSITPIGGSLENISAAGTLKELKNSSQLWAALA